jgi:pimeloyl-ACP methyl ester carboxylesterase
VLKRIRGYKAIVHDAVDFTVDMVEQGHESVARAAMRIAGLLAPIAPTARLVNELRRTSTARAFDAIRATNRLVERLTDAGLDAALAVHLLPFLEKGDAPVPMRSDAIGSAAWISDAVIGALNGAVGDYLHREKNHLAIPFGLFPLPPQSGGRDGEGLAKLAVFVHGLGATDWSWCWDAAAYHGDAALNFGTLLQRDLGVTPVYARYNTGRRVFENGKLLAERLEELVQGHTDEIILVGHSMGGLVVRSACHYANQAGHAWARRVSRVFCLGAPHQGAPLEKLGHLLTVVLGSIDHPGTRIPAEILRRRSAGMRDLRHGTIVDDAWLAHDPDALRNPREREVPLLDGVAYYFVSATVTRDRDHPLGRLIGDVLVRVGSASGPAGPARAFRIETQCFGGVVHHQLQNHPDVYALLRRACESPLSDD